MVNVTAAVVDGGVVELYSSFAVDVFVEVVVAFASAVVTGVAVAVVVDPDSSSQLV